MAKMFSDLKFTTKERRAIDDAWFVLSDIADRTGSTGAEYLRRALKLETTGSQSVPPLFAKGLICEWFRNSGDATIASLYGRREASILVAILAHASADHRRRPTPLELDALHDAARAKKAAFERRRAA